MAMIAETILSQPSQALAGLLLATLPIAWILGRGPERIIAIAAALIMALDLMRPKILANLIDTTTFRPGAAILDTLVLICVGVIALRANRFYPLVMAGAGLIAVLAHGLRWLDLLDRQFGYLMLTTIPTFVMILAYWTGLGLHIRRVRRHGPYPDWRNSAGPANDCRRAKNRIG